ncbi:MAG: hypothetical protein M1829_002038 [Trizodia sp. TS-e1964]|nr:MAG: hypothetical protein M1829_002038 [Trizodia sp. TS-e1964]
MNLEPSKPIPIAIQIPQELKHLNVPLASWLEDNPQYTFLAVGALIFVRQRPFEKFADDITLLLLVQRAASERSFPNLWEVPGGGAEPQDPTILHSVAREVFEEVGLRLTRIVRQVGDGMEFRTRVGNCLKLTFEIEVAEIPANGVALGDTTPVAARAEEPELMFELADIPIELNPEEHQNYDWADLGEIQQSIEGKGRHKFMTKGLSDTLLEGFRLRELTGF